MTVINEDSGLSFQCPPHLIHKENPQLDQQIAQSQTILYKIEALLWFVVVFISFYYFDLIQKSTDYHGEFYVKVVQFYAFFTLTNIIIHQKIEKYLPEKINCYVIKISSLGIFLVPLLAIIILFQIISFYAFLIGFAIMMSLIMAPQLITL